MKVRILFILIILLCISCSRSARLRQALHEAGENRIELEQVLAHYARHPEDSQKLAAACFLIENMAPHFSYDGPQVDQYYRDINALFARRDLNYNVLVNELNAYTTGGVPTTLLSDLQTLSAEFLIKHIDAAFETRKYPWCKILSFEDFCEYILPYRLDHEPIELWMPIYQKVLTSQFASYLNSNISTSSLCKLFSENIANTKGENNLKFSSSVDFPPSWYLHTLTQWSVGGCRELTLLGTYALRSIGVPVVWDFTPQWANRAQGHDWNAIAIEGQWVPFQVKDNTSFGNHLKVRAHDRISKVYRHMYSMQPQTLALQEDCPHEIPPFFMNLHLQDVTCLYTDCADIVLPLTNKVAASQSSIAYLTTFDNHEWVPVDWGRIKSGKAHFLNVGRGCLYLAMVYRNRSFIPITQPFFVDHRGEVQVLLPDTTRKKSIELTRKYPNYNVLFVLERMRGGLFQGANQPDFSDAHLLFRINSLEDLTPQIKTLDTPAFYRYVRYLSAPSGYVNMAELAWYSADTIPLQGSIIGTQSTLERTKENVFDQNPLTYFNASDSTGGWVGLDLGCRQLIQTIRFVPRTDNNYINRGDLYELFYFDQKWISLGCKVGMVSGGTLSFESVPENVLLLLRNYTHGNEERIFIYENEEQIWL